MSITAVSQDIAGRYHILNQLGSGGMGVVYRALDLDLRQNLLIGMEL